MYRQVEYKYMYVNYRRVIINADKNYIKRNIQISVQNEATEATVKLYSIRLKSKVELHIAKRTIRVRSLSLQNVNILT